MKFARPPASQPADSLDYTRIGAAIEGFGWDGMTTLPTCIAESMNTDWTQYTDEAHNPLSGASYAIFGVNFLGDGAGDVFICAREMIQSLATP